MTSLDPKEDLSFEHEERGSLVCATMDCEHGRSLMLSRYQLLQLKPFFVTKEVFLLEKEYCPSFYSHQNLDSSAEDLHSPLLDYDIGGSLEGLFPSLEDHCMNKPYLMGKDVSLWEKENVCPTFDSHESLDSSAEDSDSLLFSYDDENRSKDFFAFLEDQSPEPFNPDVSGCNTFRAGESPLHGYSNSMSSSCSERSSRSPSPSPPLTSQPQSRNRVSTTLSTVSLVNKPSQPSIFLSGLPHSTKTGVTGAPLQHILFIDSRPYQLIPHHQGEGFPQGLQPLQLRVLPQAQLQQQSQTQPQAHLPPQPHPQLELKASSSTVVSASRVSQGHDLVHASEKRPHHLQQEELDVCYSQESVENGDDTEDSVVITRGGTDPDYQGDQTTSNKEFADSQEVENLQANSQETAYQSKTDCPIPNLLNDSGPYGFKVHLDAKEDTLKTPTWLVSNITHKLYTNMNKPIPFRVVLKKSHQKKRFQLRAMAVFKYPMFLRQNVIRCPNHLNPSDSTNIDFSHPNHVIRADHPRAVYQTSPSGRLSVVVPLDFPENRLEAIPVLLKFMCHNSCVGGINRRPMAVLLTLENSDEEMGRYTVDVRVCACPSRDVKTEEKQLIAKGLFKKTGQHAFESRRNRKRQRKDDEPNNYDDDNIYYLPVRGMTLFNFLQDTKLQYLKHHPAYAAKNPDPPIDLSLKMLEDLHQPSSELPLEEGTTPDSPPPEESSPLSKDQGQPLFLVYTSESDKRSPRMISESDKRNSRMVSESAFPPGLRRSLSDRSLQIGVVPQGSPQGPLSPAGKEIIVNIKKERTDSGEEGEEEVGRDASSYNNARFTGTPPHKSWKKKSPKREYPSRTPNGRHKSRSSSAKALQQQQRQQQQQQQQQQQPVQLARHHLQVASMPEKEKGASLIHILPKHHYQLEETERSKLQLALEGNRMTMETINENDKVMLAAQVLASHLGAHQIDK